MTYFEDIDEYWSKHEYDSDGYRIYTETSNDNWFKFDINGNNILYETHSGYWLKRKYDSNNNEIYYEDSERFWSKKTI